MWRHFWEPAIVFPPDGCCGHHRQRHLQRALLLLCRLFSRYRRAESLRPYTGAAASLRKSRRSPPSSVFYHIPQVWHLWRALQGFRVCVCLLLRSCCCCCCFTLLLNRPVEDSFGRLQGSLYIRFEAGVARCCKLCRDLDLAGSRLLGSRLLHQQQQPRGFCTAAQGWLPLTVSAWWRELVVCCLRVPSVARISFAERLEFATFATIS